MKNETLLQKIRKSKVQGPFRIDAKASGLYHPAPLLLKRWERSSLGKSLQSAQDVADHLERHYIGKDATRKTFGGIKRGYLREIISERKRLFGGIVLKLRDIRHPNSEAVRNNYPESYVWLRVKPSF